MSLIGYLNNIQSVEQYFVFLSQILYIESTYYGEFKYLVELLDCELYNQGVDLLFNICHVIQGNRITKSMLDTSRLGAAVDTASALDSASHEIASAFFSHF